MLSPIFWWLKKVDNASAARVDLFIANSKNVAQRVKKIYKRDTRIIHPFADTDFFKPNYQTAPARLASENVAGRQLSNHQSYFLVVNRLVRWKKIDIAIEACTELNQPLIIVGTGPDGQRLKKLGSRGKGLGYSQVQFAGNVSNEKLKGLYQNAKALIVTQEEDFGISAVESLACGTPIIAYRAGGQVEILENRKTGLFFNNQTAASLKDAISTSTRVKWSSDVCRKAAQKFSKAKFISSLKEAVYANFPK